MIEHLRGLRSTLADVTLADVTLGSLIVFYHSVRMERDARAGRAGGRRHERER
jgi:hypothetical protein